MSRGDASYHDIESLIQSDEVLLFLKGSRRAPQCGFSTAVVRILDHLIPDYHTVDVLRDETLRQRLKDYSSWPTMPQLYVRGEFIGGCETVQELYASGELHRILGVELGEVPHPKLLLSDEAARTLRAAALEHASRQRTLHLTIDAGYRSRLSLAPPEPGEVRVEVEGVPFAMDPLTARRADGAYIDAIRTPHGQAFKIELPAAPKLHAVSPKELEQKMASGERFELLDVRTPEEQAKANLPGAVRLSEQELRRLESLPRSTALVFFSHRGQRARAVAQHFAADGFTQAYWLEGGIDAWSRQIDPGVPLY